MVRGRAGFWAVPQTGRTPHEPRRRRTSRSPGVEVQGPDDVDAATSHVLCASRPAGRRLELSIAERCGERQPDVIRAEQARYAKARPGSGEAVGLNRELRS